MKRERVLPKHKSTGKVYGNHQNTNAAESQQSSKRQKVGVEVKREEWDGGNVKEWIESRQVVLQRKEGGPCELKVVSKGVTGKMNSILKKQQATLGEVMETLLNGVEQAKLKSNTSSIFLVEEPTKHDVLWFMLQCLLKIMPSNHVFFPCPYGAFRGCDLCATVISDPLAYIVGIFEKFKTDFNVLSCVCSTPASSRDNALHTESSLWSWYNKIKGYVAFDNSSLYNVHDPTLHPGVLPAEAHNVVAEHITERRGQGTTSQKMQQPYAFNNHSTMHYPKFLAVRLPISYVLDDGLKGIETHPPRRNVPSVSLCVADAAVIQTYPQCNQGAANPNGETVSVPQDSTPQGKVSGASNKELDTPSGYDEDEALIPTEVMEDFMAMIDALDNKDNSP